MDTLKKQCILGYYGLLGARDVDGYDGPITQAAAGRLEGKGVRIGDAAAALDALVPFGEEAGAGSVADGGDFWGGIKYFVRAEFRCTCGRCGGFPAEPHPNMVRGAEAIREWGGKPIVPASGVRCQAHNDELPGSVPNSWHVRGQAVDLSVPGKSDAEVEAFAKTLPHYYSSYIMSGGGVHIQFSAD